MSDGKFETFISPAGILRSAYLNTPTDWQGDGNFKYKFKLDLEGADAEAFEKLIRDNNTKLGLAAKPPKKSGFSLENVIMVAQTKEGDEFVEIPGVTRFGFSVAATIETKKGLWDRKPVFYQADGGPFEVEPQIGSGTVARVCFSFYPWKNGKGITLQPTALQILELVEYRAGQGGVKRNPFAADKPVANPFATKLPTSAPKAEGSGSGADF